MKICISGYYGSANIGDELLLEAVKKIILEASGSEIEIAVLGCDPRHVKQLHGITEAGINSGWQNRKNILEGSFPAVNLVTRRILETCDLFVLGGGGLMGNDCIYNFPEVLLCKEFGIPAAAIGIGCDPFWTPSLMDLVSDYFTTFRSITTRDELSFRSLEDFGAGDKTELRQAVDPVFGLFPFAERPVRTGPIQMNVILSTIFRWFGAEGNPAQEEAIRDWAEILSGIQASGVNVKLYPFSPSLVGNYDWVRAEYVHRLAPTLPIVDSRSIPYMEVIGTLCDADLIVTDRYHGAILSAIRGIPFVTVCQDPKLRNIAAELDQPSLEPGAHDKEHVKKILSEALSGLDIQRKRLLDARCFIPDAHQTLIQEVKKIRI